MIDWDNRLDTTKLADVRNTDISKEVKAISGEMINDSIPNYELLKLGRSILLKIN